MIVDDHSGVREMLRSLLSTPGAELSECADGNEALQVYPHFQPDWVVMDSDMNELDGLSATRQLINRFPGARVLMVSEDDIEQLRRAARTAGACGFVTKDLLLPALREKQGTPLEQLAHLWMPPV